MRRQEELGLIADIADGLAVGVWVAEVPGGRFVYANQAFEVIMGMGPVPDAAAGSYAAPYGIYSRDGELYPEHRMPFVRALEARATVVIDDIVIHRRDGGRVFVRAHAKPMVDGGGAITHIAIAFIDITREVEAERARTRAEAERAEVLTRELETRRQAAAVEERLRRVVANAPIVLTAIDRDGTVTLAEGSGLSLVGNPEAFVGRSVFELFPEISAIGDSCRRALAGEEVRYSVEVSARIFDVHVAPVRDEAGGVSGAISVATDITDRHTAEVQLAQSERLASVGMLAAGVAHEINNPLTYVIGNLDLLARELGQSSGPLSAMLRDARQGADRVRSIVRDLRMFSRVDGRTLRAVDVHALLEVAMSMARHEVRHRARLVRELAPVARVWADEGRLGQVFLNLLINAAQSIREGAAEQNEVRVVTSNTRDGLVCVEVSDTGQGIAPEHRSKIFEPFFTTKAAGAGTGLGLPICLAIVTEAGGRIEVESTPGRGSTFRVLLPRASGIEPAPSERSAVSGPKSRRGALLVIDDEPLILDVVRLVLAPEHDVTCEESAVLALARIARGERFDAIVCDLMMPRMTGMDLYERLLEVAPKQAQVMIFLTGGAFTAGARSFLARVSNATIEKPFGHEVLLERVRQLVG